MSDYQVIPIWKGKEVIAFSLVDSDLAKDFENYIWRLQTARGKYLYVKRTVTVGYKTEHIWMHREVLGLPRTGGGKFGLRGDHINHDTLDNRRSNLRAVTLAQNGQNRWAEDGSTSRFRGVHWNTREKRWVAAATVNKKITRIGAFDTELLAAEAASEWRAKHMPFANEDHDKQEIEILREKKMKEYML